MQKYSRLGHGRLPQVLVSAGMHQVCDAEAENIVGLLEKFVCGGIVVVKIFAHTYELSALARKYVSFHVKFYYLIGFWMQSYSLFHEKYVTLPTKLLEMDTSTILPLFLGNLRGWEWIIIFLAILLLFGGKKIPELMRGLGKGVHSFKQGVEEAKREINKPADSQENNDNEK